MLGPMFDLLLVAELSGYPWAKILMAALMVFFLVSLLVFTERVKRRPDTYIRPISGLSALNEAVGRATEMGRPILYVPGIADMDDIQTIASMVILSEVAEVAASYDTRTIVTLSQPLEFPVAQEMVKTAFANAGRPDAYREDDVRFLAYDQFAFTAGITGIMNRERPATNIFIGSFFAESLILAETGYSTGAVQIAGTAQVAQLPFFVAACDYTLIGEEIYAASAYLSKDPRLTGSLKASDLFKVVLAILIVVGVVAMNSHAVDRALGWIFHQPSFKALFIFH